MRLIGANGDNLGIVKDSPLEVVRADEVVAKLQVSTVEASISAADIVPGSLAEGDSVRAGDQVRSPQSPAPAPQPAAAPAAAPSPEPVEPAPEPAPEPEPEPELDSDPADPFG